MCTFGLPCTPQTAQKTSEICLRRVQAASLCTDGVALLVAWFQCSATTFMFESHSFLRCHRMPRFDSGRDCEQSRERGHGAQEMCE